MPNLGSILSSWWGPGTECGFAFGFIPNASGFIFGTNPPYTVTDFLAIYPNFGGIPTNITGTVTNASPVVTVSSPTGLAAGQLMVGAGIPGGVTIVTVAGSVITLSLPATVSGTLVPLTVYTTPFVPLLVLNVFIALATASLAQARWQDSWLLAMALFVNHYATLWIRSSGNPASTPAQIVASGLAVGIQVSKAVGDVSTSSELIISNAFENWGAWNLTLAGQLLITMAQAIAGIPIMYVW